MHPEFTVLQMGSNKISRAGDCDTKLTVSMPKPLLSYSDCSSGGLPEALEAGVCWMSLEPGKGYPSLEPLTHRAR